MKKSYIAPLLVMAALLSFGLAGSLQAEEIVIAGTGDGTVVLEALSAAFSKDYPDIKISLPPSIGSGGGIKAVGTDKAVLGRVAREIKENEKEFGLTYVPVFKMPLVFLVNKNVGVDSLTAQQICDIYSGKITNWKEVGGSDGEIKVIRREDGDSTLEVLLKSFPGFKEISITDKSKTTLTVSETCELAQSKENTIAFAPYSNAKNYNLKVVSIEGKKPTDQDYPYVGVLAIIYKDGNKAGNVAKLVDFITSAAAHSVIKGNGALLP